MDERGRVPEGAEPDGMSPVDDGKPDGGAPPVGDGIVCITPGLVRVDVGAVPVKTKPVENNPEDRSSLAVT